MSTFRIDGKVVGSRLVSVQIAILYPRCSMYGIFTYIYHKFKPNVGKYSIHGAYGYLVAQIFATVYILSDPSTGLQCIHGWDCHRLVLGPGLGMQGHIPGLRVRS